MSVNMIDPWIEFDNAMDLLSRRRFTGAASVFNHDFPSLSRRKPRPTRLHSKSTDSDLTDTKVSEYDEQQRKIRNYQDEIYKLQAANSDLTQVNKRWHKYNSDMQIFIEKLQSTIRDQQEQINSIGEEQTFMMNREESISECDRPICRRLREEVIKLREEVEHLKFQVRAHKDDWEAEKLEKQEALNERDALQSRLNDVLRDICNLNRPSSDETTRRSQGCPCCKHWDRNNADYSLSSGFNPPVLCSSSRQSPHAGRYFFTDENIECDSSKKSKNIITNNLPEVEDKKINRTRKLSTTSDDKSLEDNACSLRTHDDTFSPTIPASSLIQSRAESPIPRQQATTLAMGIKTGNGATLTSYVRLPVVKSNSAPEGTLAGPSNVRLNSISLSVVPGTSSVAATSTAVLQSQPQRSLPSLPSLINTSSDDDIACPHCNEVLTSERHSDCIDNLSIIRRIGNKNLLH